MNKVLRYAIVLMCVCGASGIGVGKIYDSLKTKIEEQQKKLFNNTLKQVFPAETAKIEPAPGMDANEIADEDRVYVGLDSAGKPVAYAATGAQQGYQSEIRVLVSVKAGEKEPSVLPKDPLVVNVRVYDATETPGLGDNIKKIAATKSLWGVLFDGSETPSDTPKVPKFQAQFSSKTLAQLKVVKTADPNSIEAVTGATISSEATTEAVKKAIGKIQNYLSDNSTRSAHKPTLEP